MSNHESTLITNSGYQLAINQLLQMLEQGDEAQRCYSAQAVGKARIADAAPSLNACLYHSDSDVVVDAADALAKLAAGDMDALENVALHHPESDARLAALEALSAQAGGPEQARITTILMSFASGRQEGDDWGLSSDWDDWWDIQLKAVQLLANRPDEEVIQLFFQLLEDDPEPELESALYLGIAKATPQWLADRYQTGRVMTRRKLIRALAQSDSKIATIQLFKAMSDEDPEIRRAAVEALCRRKAIEYQWDIVLRLCDQEQRVREAAEVGLDVMGELDKLSQAKLYSLAQKAPGAALSTVLMLMACHVDEPDSECLEWIAEQLNHEDPAVVYAAADFFASIKYEGDVDVYSELAVQRCLKHVERTTLPVLFRADYIRLLCKFACQQDVFVAAVYPVMQYIVNDEQNDGVLRQAALDLLARISSSTGQQYLRELILGLAAKGELIPVNQLDIDEETGNRKAEETASAEAAGPSSESRAESSSEPASDTLELEQLLAAHEEKFSVLAEGDSPAATPTSTLASIQQTNVEAMLNSPKEEQAPEQHVLDMIEELPDDYTDYTEIVRDHFDTSDKLELNRKKVAKLPKLGNKLLALRALGNSQQPAAVTLLIEGLLGAEPAEQVDIFGSLARLADTVSVPEIKNAIGAAANTLYHGDNVTKQAATRYLAKMPMAKALPLLLQGTRDQNEHVRICSLMAIEQQLAIHTVRQQDRPVLNAALAKALQDPAGGIRKLALKLLADTDPKSHLDILLEAAISNDEVNEIAASSLRHSKEEVLGKLAGLLPDLDDHRQPLAIKLAGGLLS
ncbi:HEAT repeat domain-containing protein [Photobacterium alginatilyticum]|uniref:HEAT repeat domain-containing protein n=1 Tax=Photobacterium alginatilyticum TaxID=1775171 RepID=UPI004068F3D6